MEQLNKLLQELGISKVRLAKNLGVSIQMVYNYLGFDTLDKWPKDKKILLLKLLDLHDLDADTLENLEITNDYLNEVETRLQEGVRESQENDYLDLKGLKKEEHALLSDITYLIKEMLTDSPNHEENYYTLQYVYHMLLSVENVPEIKYLLGYLSKTCGFVKPDVFKFNEDKQKTFEGIIHSAFTLYNSGDTALKKANIIKSRERFVKEIEAKNEEKLSRTQQLNTQKIQALRELGYDSITTENAAEVWEKMAEIEARKF